MLQYFTTLILSLLAIVFLSGCGGGSDTSSSLSETTSTDTTSLDTTSTATTSITTTSTSLPTVSSSTVEILNAAQNINATGIIVDASGVKGLRIVCGVDDMITQDDGAFECENFPMSVYLGEFKLGEVAALPLTKIVYTQDIIGVALGATTHPDVTKLSMILQSLDSDALPLEGITITEESIALLNSHLGYDTTISEKTLEDTEYIIEDVLRTLKVQDSSSQLEAVDTPTAQNNLTTMTAKAAPLTYEQRVIERI